MSYLEKYREKTTNSGVKNMGGFNMCKPIIRKKVKGSVGIELEIEGSVLPYGDMLVDLKAPSSEAMWNSIRDGSLRGEAYEYVLDKPILADEIEHMVRGLWDKFTSCRTIINNTNRCSTHVHINVQGKKINTLTSIIILWATFEKFFIEWCGEERVTNHFCLSSEQSQDYIEAWEKFLEKGRITINRNIKYSSLNIRPILDIGSFEVRCGGAPSDPDRVITWVSFVQHFFSFVEETFQNPMQIGYDISEKTPYSMLKEICGDKFSQFFEEIVGNYSHGDFDALSMEGFRRVQNLVYGFPWDIWMVEINKKFVPQPFDKTDERFLDEDAMADIARRARLIGNAPRPVRIRTDQF